MIYLITTLTKHNQNDDNAIIKVKFSNSIEIDFKINKKFNF